MSNPFAQRLLREGRLLVDAQPDWHPTASDRTAVENAYANMLLDLAGPPVPIDLDTALAAVRVTYRAAWFLLNPGTLSSPADPSLTMSHPPVTPAEHLAADLSFRFLADLLHRAKNRPEHEELRLALERLLREWPFSGVLSEIAEPPTTALDFAGHPGLALRYAERLAEQDRPSWYPPAANLGHVELVWQSLGKNTELLKELTAGTREVE
jgi:hypothetical protein